MTGRARISATVEADLLAAAREAVAAGHAESLSSWINSAIRRQIDHERRLRELQALIASYEEVHGEISDEEILAAKRSTGTRAVVVRPSRRAV